MIEMNTAIELLKEVQAAYEKEMDYSEPILAL